MNPSVPSADPSPSRPSVLDTALQIGLVALLIYACARIVLPFVDILLWSAIVAVMLYPLHLRVSRRLGNRWSALLIGLVGVAVMMVAMVTVATSLASSLYSLVDGLNKQSLTVPPPPVWVEDLPIVGHKLAETWARAASDIPEALIQYGKALREPAIKVISAAGGLAAGQLSFVLSFGIAAVLVAYADGAVKFTRRLLELFTGSEASANHLVPVIAFTIRGVALGVVGVAVIQALLLGVGFFAIGLPAAGLWTLATLLLCIVQVPAVLVTLPIIAYVFTTEAMQPAIIFTVWILLAGLSDNVLKPLMLGRGLETPMPVILLGVIGGMIVDGLLGLFVGPVVLAVAYALLQEWMQPRDRFAPSRPEGDNRSL